MEKNNLRCDFISTDEETQMILEKSKNDYKTYNRISEFLQIKGNFDKNILVTIYDGKNDENNNIRLWCIDQNENIFIICPISNNKEEKNIIVEVSDVDETIYDISLLKKAKITKDNIELAKCSYKYNFSFGRLITDDKTYYNLFLGDNICYQVKCNVESDFSIYKILLSKLNSLKSKPKLLNYINIITEVCTENNLDIHMDQVTVYENFKKIEEIVLSNMNNKQKTKTKKH